MTVGFFDEVIGSSAPNALQGQDLQIVYGLGGNDDLASVPGFRREGADTTIVVGGPGNDTYRVGNNSTLIVFENGNSGNDTLVATGIGLNRDATESLTIEGKHLLVGDFDSQQFVIVLDYLDFANRIENVVLSDGQFSFSQVSDAVSAESLGDFTFQQLISADDLDLARVGLNPTVVSQTIEAVKSRQESLLNGFTIGRTYALNKIKDFDGNLHGVGSFNGDLNIYGNYQFQGTADVQGNNISEYIFTNQVTGRWATAEVDSVTGEIDYSRNGSDGSTRVVGIYTDPLVESGLVARGSDFDSQRRFQNDLAINNLLLKTAGDFDADGFQEMYWKTADGTAYLRALMHADGNIQYANYQNQQQVEDYLTNTGNVEVIQTVI